MNISVTFLVSKLDKSNPVNHVDLVNIPLIVSTLLVSRVSNQIKFTHDLISVNIKFILFTLVVSQFVTSIDSTGVL